MKNALFIVLIAVGILLFGCSAPEKQPFESIDCDAFKDKEGCYMKTALETKNESMCTKIINTEYRDECLLKVGIVKSNAFICEQIEDLEMAAKCYGSIALKENDPLLCNKKSGFDWTRNCYNPIAIATQNLSLCDMLWVEPGEEYIGYDPNMDDCYVHVALGKQNISICGMISNKRSRGDCYLGFGVSKEDTTLCDNGLSSGTDCYAVIAILKNDSRVCEQGKQMENNFEKNICISRYQNANVGGQLDSCRTSNCFYGLAIATTDIAICDNMEGYGYLSDAMKINCYSAVAIKLKKPEICNLLEVESQKNYCYTNVGKAN